MKIIKEGSSYYFKNSSLQEIDNLPKGVYFLEDDFVLSKKSDFTLPKKLYGDTEEVAERYLKYFNNTNSSVGVLLTGLRGSGKTSLARLVSINSNLPIIVIPKYFENLYSFLANISQEVVVFFDEFEKTYDTIEKQNDLLPILDGVFSYKKLFIFTSNTDKVNKFILNRPGRIRYHKSFNGLEKSVILNIVEDCLQDKKQADEVVEVCDILGEISLDSLFALIAEMNMFKEDVRSAIKHLNVEIENHKYEVILIVAGKRFKTNFNGHPLAAEETIIYYNEDNEKRWYSSEKEYRLKLKEFDWTAEDEGKLRFTHKENQDTLIFNKLFTKKFEI